MFVSLFVLLQLSALHWLHNAHDNWLSHLHRRCILNAAESFICLWAFLFYFLHLNMWCWDFLIEQTNCLFSYLLTNEPVNLFGLFFVNILFSVVCFSLGVWSAIFQILSSIFLKFMKCYLLLLSSTQKPYCYLMVRFLTKLDMGTWMRPNSVFLLAVVGLLLHSLNVFVPSVADKNILETKKKKRQVKKALGLVSREVCVNGI